MNIYRDAINLLEQNKNFVFATIITDSGSTPRSKGAKMIVKKDGSIYGTVGGGSMEAVCINKAIDVINNKKSIIHRFNLNNKDAALTDMICGGSGEILIDYIDASDKSNLEVFSKALDSSLSGKKGWVVALLEEDTSKAERRELLFIDEEDKLKEKHSLGESLRVIIDPVHSLGKAYIFGAGHVSKDVATILNLLEFRTIVIDDREEFANKERFPESDVVVLDSLENIPDLAVDDDSYILIITRGHIHDSNVLEWALKTNAYYIGMIGSKRKVKLTYDKLTLKGYSEEKLSKVYSPIGIKLKAQTPAEIAVSIAAELINCRAEKAIK